MNHACLIQKRSSCRSIHVLPEATTRGLIVFCGCKSIKLKRNYQIYFHFFTFLTNVMLSYIKSIQHKVFI